jgi:hypothetical protein
VPDTTADKAPGATRPTDGAPASADAPAGAHPPASDGKPAGDAPAGDAREQNLKESGERKAAQ